MPTAFFDKQVPSYKIYNFCQFTEFMISETDVENLKRRAVRSGISCRTERANSLGWMLAFSPASGKHVREGLYKHIGAVVEAVFAGDEPALDAAKEALVAEIKRVQPVDRLHSGPHFQNDEVIRELTDRIANNVTRFTRHLQKATRATEEAGAQPETVIDGATAVSGERASPLFGPGYKKVPGPLR